jgi:hypothetical protein
VYAPRQADDYSVDRLAQHLRSLVLSGVSCALAVTLLGGCTSVAKSGASAVSAAAPAGPPNAAVPSAGTAGPIPLDDDQSAELRRTVDAMPPDVRARLRYALALGDDGRRHLVVYDGEGLGENGREHGKAHEYLLFQVLNVKNGEHYDPQQNAIVAPMPVPPERAGSAAAL